VHAPLGEAYFCALVSDCSQRAVRRANPISTQGKKSGDDSGITTPAFVFYQKAVKKEALQRVPIKSS